MTRSEALTILRDARSLYTNLSHLAHRHDLKAINKVAPIVNANLLQLYAIEHCYNPKHPAGDTFRWKAEAFPLYYAIRMASLSHNLRFEFSLLDEFSLVRIVNNRYERASQIDRIAILIRASIMQLPDGHIIWPKFNPPSAHCSLKTAH